MTGLGWAHIADDLIFILAERVVSVATFIRFSAVCKSWYSITCATKIRNPVPWLMLAEKEGSDVRDFYDHSLGELYQIPLPHARGVKVVGSSHGWLLTTSASKGGSFHLLNPNNESQIVLLSTDEFPPVSLRNILDLEGLRDIFIIKATCSSINLNGDYIVAAIHMGLDGWFLSYRKGADRKWSCIEHINSAKSVGIVDDNIFMVTCYGDLYLIKIISGAPSVAKLVNVPKSDGPYPREHQCYFVNCAGAILVASKVYTFTSPISTKYFDVFEVDMKGNQLIRVTDIGNYALFLGGSFSVALQVTPCMKKIKRNCIYFIDDRNEQSHCRRMKCGGDMGVYDIKEGFFTHHYPLTVTDSTLSMPIWVTINPFHS